MLNLESVYNQYHVKVYNLAYRMTGNRDDASDITQETFEQALKSIHKFKGESQIYTWLYSIAKNNCLRHLKKKQRSNFNNLQMLADKVSSPVAEFTEAEKSSYIEQVKDGCLSGLLRCLSLQQRVAFILNVLLDVPLDQVALIIEKTENATRILTHRARQNIREYLCNNCSLYDSGNRCRCENLINFSLKQGWIGKDLEFTKNISQAEKEIKDLKSEISLYKTLAEIAPTNANDQQIKRLLAQNEDFLVLTDKKVK